MEELFDSPLEQYTWERLSSQGLMSPEATSCFYNCQKSSKMDCYGISGDDQWMWCHNLNDRWRTPIVSVVGCCGNFLPLLRRNANYGEFMQDVFGGMDMATPLYRTLFRPAEDKVTATVPFAKRDRPASGYIAAQVRLFNPSDNRHLIETMSACLSYLLSLPEHKGAAVYLAAMSQQLIDQIKSKLGNGVRFLQNKPPGSEQHTASGLHGALRDMWGLAQADALVLTPWSSFGSYASTLSNVTPWELEGNMGSITGKCHMLVSKEPCCMRNWGPVPNSCPKPYKKPLRISKGSERLCGFDHGAGGAFWKGINVDKRSAKKPEPPPQVEMTTTAEPTTTTTEPVAEVPEAEPKAMLNAQTAASAPAAIAAVAAAAADFANAEDDARPRSEKCDALKMYRYAEDGSLWARSAAGDTSQVTDSWASLAGFGWVIRSETLKFLNDFLKLQDDILCRTPQNKQRFMFIRRDNGLGNSLQAAAAYIVMAFLTKRAIVMVGWGETLQKIFDSPISWFEFEKLQSLGLMSVDAMKAFYNCEQGPEMECFGVSADDMWMYCSPLSQRFSKRIVSVVGCCGNFLPLLRRNPHHSEDMERLFGDYELAIPIYRTLFRPSKELVASKTVRPPDASQAYISAQVRVFAEAQNKHLLEAMAVCLRHLLEKPGFKNAAVYMAAVNQKLIDGLKQRLGGEIVVLQHKPPGAEQHGDVHHNINAMKDLWALAQGDAVILTPWSTFGSLAGAYSKTIPWELEGNMGSLTGKCQRVLSGEPCGMRNWGPKPDKCPKQTLQPLRLPSTLDRRCGFDHGAGGAIWRGPSVVDKPD
eukprot:TRINITY_DN41954_c0_g2_i1.p1 TRINITY_DN41954_c0_g2~~TRINITY_DN41954_c0_g2_i1.p1  ORF type:complete len:954 (-),score=221.52 TRINITY_DN41954_c0_g2_i1:449-2890(-)